MAYEFNTTYGVAVDSDERAQFFRRVFMHLAGAVALFVGLEYLLLDSELGNAFSELAFRGGRGGWLLILAGFSLVTWMARGMSHALSRPLQYLGLGLYAFAEALLFVPLLRYAQDLLAKSGELNTLLLNAAILTGILFLSMVLVVLVSRRDFSFLRTALLIGGSVALGLIVCGAFLGFSLGLAFSGAMVVLACAAILYDTSRIMHTYPSEMYVAAAAELFASLMLLLWYVLRILLSRRR